MHEGLVGKRSQRRAVLRAALAVGLGLPVLRLCPRVARDAAAQGGDPKSQRPQAGDRFAFNGGERAGQLIGPADLPLGGPPVTAYPVDARTGTLRDGSRLNQILLVRFSSGDLSEETRGRSGNGIVAYSGVCTHAGCDVTLWKAEVRRFRCPCHESEFDPRDGARVVGGPAPRRLPALAVKIADGALVAGGGFMGRPGFQPG
jgi:nitrite reductase/ring-hydroxylating ferredoxin subunit